MNSKLIVVVVGVMLAATSFSQVLQKRGLPPRRTILTSTNSLSTNVSTVVDYKKIRSEQRQKVLEELPKMPMSSVSLQPSWTRGVDTNGVVITVYVGGIDNGQTFNRRTAFHLFRNLTFDKDGRLVSVSPVIPGKYNPYVSNSNPSNVGQLD